MLHLSINNEFAYDVYDVYTRTYSSNFSFKRLSRKEKFEIIQLYFLNNYKYSCDFYSSLKNLDAVFNYFVSCKHPNSNISLKDDSHLPFLSEFIKFVCSNFSCPNLIFEDSFIEYISNKIDLISDHFIDLANEWSI